MVVCMRPSWEGSIRYWRLQHVGRSQDGKLCGASILSFIIYLLCYSQPATACECQHIPVTPSPLVGSTAIEKLSTLTLDVNCSCSVDGKVFFSGESWLQPKECSNLIDNPANVYQLLLVLKLCFIGLILWLTDTFNPQELALLCTNQQRWTVPSNIWVSRTTSSHHRGWRQTEERHLAQVESSGA